MARKKRPMFRGQQMAVRVAQPRRTSGAFDWITSSASVDNNGSPLAAGRLVSWGPTPAPGPLAAGANYNYQAIVIQPTPMASTPTVGRMRVDEIRGSLFITNGDAVSAPFDFAVGIYVSDLNNTTTLWNVRNVADVTEASRDDYLFLEGKQAVLPAAGTDTTTAMAIEFVLHLSQPVILGGGQSLMVSLCQAGNPKAISRQAINVSAYFRTRVGPVA